MEIRQIVDDYKIGQPPGCDRAPIVQAKKACRIICCGLYRRDGIDSLPDGKTDIIVQMPEPEQVVRMPVITAKHAAIGAAALKQRHKR